MSRPILKLPNKTAARADDARSSLRKPLRQGGLTAKRIVVRREETVTDGRLRPERQTVTTRTGKVIADGHRSSAPQATPNAIGVAQQRLASVEIPHREGGIRRPSTDDKSMAVSTSAGGRKPLRNDAVSVSGARSDVDRLATGKRSQPPRAIACSNGAGDVLPVPRVATGEQPLITAKAAPVAADAPTDAVVQTPVADSEPTHGPARELPRLSRLVVELAGCSRREADEWLQNGWVRVDGVLVDRLGARVSPKARIEIAAAAQRQRVSTVTVIYHQAVPFAQGDDKLLAASLLAVGKRWADDVPGGQPTVAHLPASRLRALPLVGRLAADEYGMQVFSEQAGVARRLSDTRVEHEFHVRIAGTPSAEGLERLRYGQRIAGIKLKRAQVSLSSDGLLRFVLRDHRPGQIAERCLQIGLQVLAIKRVRIGSVLLGKLPAGQWRFLRPDERF